MQICKKRLTSYETDSRFETRYETPESVRHSEKKGLGRFACWRPHVATVPGSHCYAGTKINDKQHFGLTLALIRKDKSLLKQLIDH